VQVDQVDVVGPQPLQAGVHRLIDPFAGQPALVDAVAHRVGELGGDEPPVAPVGDGAAHDLFRLALVVDVGGVDEVDIALARLVDDPARYGLVGRTAEHHGAQRDR
jgi:hypothetical protein